MKKILIQVYNGIVDSVTLDDGPYRVVVVDDDNNEGRTFSEFDSSADNVELLIKRLEKEGK